MGSGTQAQFTIVGIDGDELTVFAGGFRRNIGGTSTDVRWTPDHAHRYLDGYAIGTNDMIGKALLIAEIRNCEKNWRSDATLQWVGQSWESTGTFWLPVPLAYLAILARSLLT